MYRMDERCLAGEDHLFAFLDSWGKAAGGDIGIVAGHFMLMYDGETSGLVPMIWQDAKNKQVASVSKALAGDFPVYTFSLGLQAFDIFSETHSPKILLVVNDHLFQSSSWNSSFGRSDKDAGELRRAFYRDAPRLPPSYELQMSQSGKTFEETFLDNHNSVRNKQSILPQKTYFFSEQVFRNQFGRDTEAFLRSRFFYSQKDGEQSSIMFSPWGQAESAVCLTEDGRCGCSGEVIQMLLHLAEREINTVLCFVPEECVLAFNQGVKATLHFIAKSMRVVVIAGSNNDFSRIMEGDPDIAVLFEVFSHQWDTNQ